MTASDRELELLRVAASAERNSEHPLAEAIVERAKLAGLALSEPTAFNSLTGRGVEATVEGRAVLLGNPALMAERGIDLTALDAEIERLQNEGKTAMVVAVDGEVQGLIAVADTVKESSGAAIARMHKQGLRVVMLTGDNWRTARAIARQVGLDPEREVTAEVLPGGKADVVRAEQAQGGRWRWSATASTMPRRWPSPTWAWPSAPARTSPSKRPT